MWQFRVNYSCQNGYSLVELIVVIAVILILTGTATVSLNDINQNARLSNAAMHALSDIRYAQELAMSTSREVCVFVNAANETYDIKWKDTGTHIPSPVNQTENLSVTFGSNDYKQIEITSSDIPSGLSFTTLGEPLINNNRFANERSVMFLNDKIHVVVYPSGYTCLEEVIGSGCTGC